MKNLKNKRGISLIVLVITIIVMIILATAIILSLNNSGIIGKANKAKNDSDTATLKEYVNTLKLDWEFMTAEEKTAAGSFSEYATSKLEEKGYNRMVTEDGVILTEGATAAVKAGIEIGDEVTGYNNYLSSLKSEKSKLENNGKKDQDILVKNDFAWKYIGINANGEIEIAADITTDSPTITFYGKTGWLSGSGELNDICGKLYDTDKGTARSMNIDDVVELLKYTGNKGGYYARTDSGNIIETTPSPLTIEKIGKLQGVDVVNNSYVRNYATTLSDYYKITQKQYDSNLVYFSTTYWLSSSCALADLLYAGGTIPTVLFGIRCVSSSTVDFFELSCTYCDDWDEATYAIRPVVALNDSAQIIPPSSSDGAWTIK